METTLKSLSNIELMRLSKLDNEYFKLDENDFYRPMDDRTIQSGVSDVYGGDSFAQYAAEFFEAYESDLFD